MVFIARSIAASASGYAGVGNYTYLFGVAGGCLFPSTSYAHGVCALIYLYFFSSCFLAFCCTLFLFASLPANVGVHTGGLAAAGAIPCPVMEGLEPGAPRVTRGVTLNLKGRGGGFSRGSMGAALRAKKLKLKKQAIREFSQVFANFSQRLAFETVRKRFSTVPNGAKRAENGAKRSENDAKTVRT